MKFHLRPKTKLHPHVDWCLLPACIRGIPRAFRTAATQPSLLPSLPTRLWMRMHGSSQTAHSTVQCAAGLLLLLTYLA